MADEKLENDLLLAQEKGNKACIKFIEDRLVSKAEMFHDPLPRMNLQTFSVKNKHISVKENARIKADRNLFARLLVIAQSRLLNMREVLEFELGPVPWSIACASGTLVKTNKSVLCNTLEKGINPVEDIPSDSAWIFDGMAIIQAVTKVPTTFGDLASSILHTVLNVAKTSKRIDFVCDSYPDLSIKNLERDKRASYGQVITKVTRPSQSCTRQWKKFLSVGENKAVLVDFLVQEWSKQDHLSKLSGKELFVSHGNHCHKIFVENEIVLSEEFPDLSSNQEEADTKIFLHAKNAASNGHTSIVIKSSDTDVEVLACFFRRISKQTCIYSRELMPGQE